MIRNTRKADVLEEILIEDLGVINRAHLLLRPGLTAITGETGAGKTMLLTGLSLLMGDKADSSRVRTGAQSAVVEGRVTVGKNSPVRQIVADAGGTLDDDESLVILRTMAAQGRSRAHLGGRSVPQTVLAQVASEFVTIHGQSEQMRLRSPARQRQALDDYLGPEHAKMLVKYRAVWSERVDTARQLTELQEQRSTRNREAELLRLGLAEVERVSPQPGEDAEITAEIGRLSNVEDLNLGMTEAHTALRGDEYETVGKATAISLVESARKAIELNIEHDESLAALLTRLSEVSILLNELGADTASYLASLASDPQRLAFLQARRAELTTLLRSYGATINEVLTWAKEASQRLLDLEGGDERLASLITSEAELSLKVTALAEKLTQARTVGAQKLGTAVSAELEGLAMAGAQLQIDIEADPDGPGTWGADRVVMRLIPHPGAPASLLGKGASGGELSRVMLGIEVALAQNVRTGTENMPTFVFDEVDAGVGGRAALEVGRRLAELAKSAQVIVVTHLAQVAAFADQQIVVSRSGTTEEETVTQSDVREVTDDARIEELARMLSGQDESTAARRHAAELLKSAVVG